MKIDPRVVALLPSAHSTFAVFAVAFVVNVVVRVILLGSVIFTAITSTMLWHAEAEVAMCPVLGFVIVAGLCSMVALAAAASSPGASDYDTWTALCYAVSWTLMQLGLMRYYVGEDE